MEQTPLPPLVSELRKVLETFIPEDVQFVHGMQRSDENNAFVNEVVIAVNKVYEPDRQRTREVVQALVNGINDARFALFASGKVELANTLAEIEILAKSQLQIEPKPCTS